MRYAQNILKFLLLLSVNVFILVLSFYDDIPQSDPDFFEKNEFIKHTPAIATNLELEAEIQSAYSDDTIIHLFVFDQSNSNTNATKNTKIIDADNRVSTILLSISDIVNRTDDITNHFQEKKDWNMLLMLRMLSDIKKQKGKNFYRFLELSATKGRYYPSDTIIDINSLTQIPSIDAPILKFFIETSNDEKKYSDFQILLNSVDSFSLLHHNKRVIVTIFSDFIHTTAELDKLKNGNKILLAEKTHSIEINIKQKIKNLINRRVKFNLISISQKDAKKEIPKEKIDIKEIFINNLEWYEYNELYIENELTVNKNFNTHSSKLVNLPVFTSNYLIFRYFNDRKVNSKTSLITKMDNLNVGIVYSDKLNGKTPPFNMNCYLKGKEIPIIIGETKNLKNSIGDTLTFVFEGNLMDDTNGLNIQLQDKENSKNFIIPIKFSKALPKIIVNVLICSKTLAFIFLILTFIAYIPNLCRFFSHKKCEWLSKFSFSNIERHQLAELQTLIAQGVFTKNHENRYELNVTYKDSFRLFDSLQKRNILKEKDFDDSDFLPAFVESIKKTIDLDILIREDGIFKINNAEKYSNGRKLNDSLSEQLLSESDLQNGNTPVEKHKTSLSDAKKLELENKKLERSVKETLSILEIREKEIADKQAEIENQKTLIDFKEKRNAILEDQKNKKTDELKQMQDQFDKLKADKISLEIRVLELQKQQNMMFGLEKKIAERETQIEKYKTEIETKEVIIQKEVDSNNNTVPIKRYENAVNSARLYLNRSYHGSVTDLLIYMNFLESDLRLLVNSVKNPAFSNYLNKQFFGKTNTIFDLISELEKQAAPISEKGEPARYLFDNFMTKRFGPYFDEVCAVIAYNKITKIGETEITQDFMQNKAAKAVIEKIESDTRTVIGRCFGLDIVLPELFTDRYSEKQYESGTDSKILDYFSSIKVVHNNMDGLVIYDVNSPGYSPDGSAQSINVMVKPHVVFKS